MSVEHRVDEPNGTLSHRESLFIDLEDISKSHIQKKYLQIPVKLTYQIEHRRKQRRRQTGSIVDRILSIIERREPSTISRDIGICPPNAIVAPLGLVDIHAKFRVIGIGQISCLEVFLHGSFLVLGLREVVGESTGRTKVGRFPAQVCMHHALCIIDGLVGVEHCASD